MTTTLESPNAAQTATEKEAKEKLPSSAVNDFGVKVGQFLVRRRAAEWVLTHTPVPVADGIRGIVARGFRAIGDKYMLNEEALYHTMNGKMFMSTQNGDSEKPVLEEVPEGYLESLFPKGKQQEWPQQLILCTKDITPSPEVMHGRMKNVPALIEKLLKQDENRVNEVSEPVAGKTVILGAFHTDNSILHNGADVIERVQEIRRDPLSLKGMSPAAMKMGETLLNLMTERQDGETRILREDAPDIMRHTMLHGFSQGGNVTSDAFRFMRHEMRTKPVALALDAEATRSTPLNHDAAIAKLFAGSYILNIAAADVPFSRAELSCMPPRDNIRSDGDMVVSGAVGLNKQQSNYNYLWKQDELNLLRNDRLLEAIGPVKRFLGIGQPKDRDDSLYHGQLGHSEREYWDKAVDQAKTALQERLVARFKDRTVASDVTFAGDGSIKLDFERGTQPETAQRDLAKFILEITKVEGISIIPSDDPTPYKLRLSAPQEAETLGHIRKAFDAAGIHPTKEVGMILDVADKQPWLEASVKKIPAAAVSSHFDARGPFFEIDLGECAGSKTFGLLKRELEKNCLPTENLELEGSKLRVPGHGLVAAFKNAEMKERCNAR